MTEPIGTFSVMIDRTKTTVTVQPDRVEWVRKEWGKRPVATVVPARQIASVTATAKGLLRFVQITLVSGEPIVMQPGRKDADALHAALLALL